MTVRKRLERSIRGWLPKEPILPSYATPSQRKPNHAKTIFQNIIFGFLVAGLLCSLVLLSNSWIKFLILAITLVAGVVWLASHGRLRNALKFTLVAVMLFAISFTAFEGYLFWNAGYPSTYIESEPTVTISYPRILNISLTEVVQSAEKTTAFSLFKVEHPGEVTSESILLDTTFPGGRIEVTFYNEAANTGFGFIASSGYPYHASAIPRIGQPPSRLYSQQQTPEETLKQIDSLGLHWFYERASEIYQNRTGTSLNITSLEVSTQWLEYDDFQGMNLWLVGWQRVGNSLYDVFNAAFQPDGTLLNMNIPSKD